MAALVPHYEYDESEFFRADDAPVDVAEQRRAGFMRLAALYAERYATTATLTREVEDEISDLQFTDRYRVPFQFRGLVRKHLKRRFVRGVVRRCATHRPRRQPAL